MSNTYNRIGIYDRDGFIQGSLYYIMQKKGFGNYSDAVRHMLFDYINKEKEKGELPKKMGFLLDYQKHKLMWDNAKQAAFITYSYANVTKLLLKLMLNKNVAKNSIYKQFITMKANCKGLSSNKDEFRQLWKLKKDELSKMIDILRQSRIPKALILEGYSFTKIIGAMRKGDDAIEFKGAGG